MSRNNDVFTVLIPTVATIAVAGTGLGALAEGALGAFDYDTNLAVDGPVDKFFFAVGIKDLDGVSDINRSGGTHIQSRNIVSLTSNCYTAPVQMVTASELKVMRCGGEVGVKVEIRNQEAYRLNGYNQVVKNFIVPTSECVDCDSTCEDENSAAVLQSLVDLINDDADKVVVASITSVTANSVVTQSLVMTVNPKSLKKFSEINLGYFFPNQTEIIVTSTKGFKNATITTPMVYEEGAGTDVKQLEYVANGWKNSTPYRVSPLNGVALEGAQYFADQDKKYDLIHLSYDQVSVSGWESNAHFMRTIIATSNEAGALSKNVGDFVNVMTAGKVDAIEVCDNQPSS